MSLPETQNVEIAFFMTVVVVVSPSDPFIRKWVYNTINFSLSENLVFMWQKLSSNSDPKIIAMDDIITSTDERFKARTSIEKNAEGDKMGSTLVIASAEDGDAGNYICQLATGKDPKELKYTVEIRGNSYYMPLTEDYTSMESREWIKPLCYTPSVSNM